MSAVSDENRPASPEPRHFVLIARGGCPFALAIEDTAQIGLTPRICGGKTCHRACLGFLELQGQRVVLFDVAAALSGEAPHGPPPRMFVRLRTDPPTALAADTIQSVCALTVPAESASEFIQACVETGGWDIPLLDVEQVRRAAHGISVISVLARRLEDIEA